MIYKKYETSRLNLIPSDPNYINPIYDYIIRNRIFLEKYEPKRTNNYYAKSHILNQLNNDIENSNGLHSMRFWIEKKLDYKIIGSISLSNIILGDFLSCFLGYRLDAFELNNGYMTEAIEKTVEIAFDNVKLHRIEANVMPRNKPSLRVLEKTGFKYEGISPKYLKINDNWEDHIHMVILNDNEVLL